MSLNATPTSHPPGQTWQAEVNRKLQSTAKVVLERGAQQEQQIKELEARLLSELSNSRNIHNLLIGALNTLKSNGELVDRALSRHIPYIHEELRGSMESLLELEQRLPETIERVHTIRDVYNAGRITAKSLTAELEWRQASAQDKARRIIFTRSSPVSSAEVAAARFAFCIVFLLFVWQLGGALDGAYRAYRHRLVWGDKLMS